MRKLPKDWIIVSFVAMLGIGCLVASNKIKEKFEQDSPVTAQEFLNKLSE